MPLSYSLKNILTTIRPFLGVFIFLYAGVFIYAALPDKNEKEISVTQVKNWTPILQAAAKKDLSLKDGNRVITVKSNELELWVEPYFREYTGQEDYRFVHERILAYLEALAPKLNTPPVNAQLKFSNNKASIFNPSVNGRRLKIPESSASIIMSMKKASSSAELLFETVEPEITLEKINDLGISALIGKGESDYGKSSSARISNIKIGMSKFNGLVLKPGEEFSFNQILGEVEEAQGYQAELVIKNGQLVKEFGGGLCQVATTIFRSAIWSGLQIKERKPHSFPVQYYDPQGFDATIYPGIVDLKFVNNTNAHVLIQAKLTGSRLSVEMYGSKEGREVKLEGPVQYDKKPTGSMKAYFIRRIYTDGELSKEERFDSVYKAPPASPLERNPLE